MILEIGQRAYVRSEAPDARGYDVIILTRFDSNSPHSRVHVGFTGHYGIPAYATVDFFYGHWVDKIYLHKERRRIQ